jgi:ABC-2 type transport system ATP-binding protein
VAIIRAGNLMAVHDVAELLARRKRKVMLRWRGAAPDPMTLPGLSDVVVDGSRIIGTLSGDIAGFVRSIGSPNLEDLIIEPASLEEAFLEYYADGDGTDAAAEPEAAAR